MKFALDCEMVASGNISILAKVSIVDEYGRVVFNKFAKPTCNVTDYRTEIHGISSQNLATGESFYDVQREVQSILDKNIVVGHSLKFDLEVLKITCPPKNVRDLAEYPPLQKGGQPVSLKELAEKHLGMEIQRGFHDSVEDAKAAMKLYLKFADQWERSN